MAFDRANVRPEQWDQARIKFLKHVHDGLVAQRELLQGGNPDPWSGLYDDLVFAKTEAAVTLIESWINIIETQLGIDDQFK